MKLCWNIELSSHRLKKNENVSPRFFKARQTKWEISKRRIQILSVNTSQRYSYKKTIGVNYMGILFWRGYSQAPNYVSHTSNMAAATRAKISWERLWRHGCNPIITLLAGWPFRCTVPELILLVRRLRNSYAFFYVRHARFTCSKSGDMWGGKFSLIYLTEQIARRTSPYELFSSFFTVHWKFYRLDFLL